MRLSVTHGIGTEGQAIFHDSDEDGVDLECPHCGVRGTVKREIQSNKTCVLCHGCHSRLES